MGDGLPPNSELTPLTAVRVIPSKPPPTFVKPENWNADLNHFVALCLTKEPQNRPSTITLLTVMFSYQKIFI